MAPVLSSGSQGEPHRFGIWQCRCDAEATLKSAGAACYAIGRGYGAAVVPGLLAGATQGPPRPGHTGFEGYLAAYGSRAIELLLDHLIALAGPRLQASGGRAR